MDGSVLIPHPPRRRTAYRLEQEHLYLDALASSGGVVVNYDAGHQYNLGREATRNSLECSSELATGHASVMKHCDRGSPDVAKDF